MMVFTSGFFVGSSPLARGTPEEAELQEIVKRIIPARAGNT